MNTYRVTITIEVQDVAAHAPEDAVEFVKDMVNETLREHAPAFTAASVTVQSPIENRLTGSAYDEYELADIEAAMMFETKDSDD
jgi:hypothetical protein